jgi:Na+/H+-dicarboxylate symporter
MIDAPKNLTRNILLGMFIGFIVGAALYYSNFFPYAIKQFVEIYIFNLGSSIFVNLLKLLIVPLVFFSLVSGISSLTNMTSLGNITFKTITLYLSTTAIAVSLSLIIGSIFKPGQDTLLILLRQINSLKAKVSMRQFWIFSHQILLRLWQIIRCLLLYFLVFYLD